MWVACVYLYVCQTAHLTKDLPSVEDVSKLALAPGELPNEYCHVYGWRTIATVAGHIALRLNIFPSALVIVQGQAHF